MQCDGKEIPVKKKNVCVFMHACVYVCMLACMYVCDLKEIPMKKKNVCVCMYVCILWKGDSIEEEECMCMYVCMYACMHVCVL
jgi:hypothetical protein